MNENVGEKNLFIRLFKWNQMSKIKNCFFGFTQNLFFSCFINADRCYMNEIGLMNKYLNEHSHVSDCGLGIFNEIEISICVCLHSNSK